MLKMFLGRFGKLLRGCRESLVGSGCWSREAAGRGESNQVRSTKKLKL